MRRDRHIAPALLLLFCLTLAGAAPADVLQPPSWHVVTRVVDGDTVDVEAVGRIRLIGVDTPETVDPRRPVERFGREASEFLKRLVQGRRVRLEYDQQRKDAYNRTLAYLYLPDGAFVNAEIVKQGYGFAYTRFPFRYLEEFRRLEREAREAGRGLWGRDAAERAASGAAPASAEQDAQVFVTRTGEKYHRAGCRYLARSRIPIALADARTRYGPCAVCRPPASEPSR